MSLYLQDSSQLSVEEADKLLAVVVLLREGEDHATDGGQQLVGTHLVHVLLNTSNTTTHNTVMDDICLPYLSSSCCTSLNVFVQSFLGCCLI